MRVVSAQMRPRPRRTRLERLLMLAPGAFRAFTGTLLRLPVGSRLRTAMLKIVVDRSFSALDRGDFEFVARVFFHPDSVLRFAEHPGPGYERVYRGRDTSFGIYRRWLSDWGEMRRRPVGFVDRGDTLVVLGYERVVGEGSGVEIERELGQVFRLRGGGVVDHTEYRHWDDALAP